MATNTAPEMMPKPIHPIWPALIICMGVVTALLPLFPWGSAVGLSERLRDPGEWELVVAGIAGVLAGVSLRWHGERSRRTKILNVALVGCSAALVYNFFLQH